MKTQDIPQDDSKSYHGHQKIIYATENGRYQAATSSGWQDESYATEQAVADLDAKREAAREAVLRGDKSPLYYWMFHHRHDEASLAQAAGFFRFQVRRHCRADVFARLSDKTLAKYADALQMPLENLKRLP